jgi:hypothetical protein
VAGALIRYVLGFVPVEQNHAELVRARIVEPRPPTPDAEQAFSFGVRWRAWSRCGPKPVTPAPCEPAVKRILLAQSCTAPMRA